MKQRDEEFPPVPSPRRLFLTVLAISFLTEAAVMFLLQVLLPDLHLYPLVASIADAAMMVVLAAPFLWWFLARPLRRIAVAEHVRAATVIRRARDGIISMNEQGLIESFNPAATHTFGYRAEEVVGKPLTLLMPERYRDAHQRGVERVQATGASDLLEGRMFEGHGLRKDGTEFPLECSVAAWTTGTETRFVGIVRDITERKRAEKALQRNNDTQNVINSLLRFSMEEAPLGDLLQRTLDLILSIPWLAFESRGSLSLVEAEPAVLVMKAQRGLAEPIQEACARVPFGKCLCGRAAATQEIQFAERLDDRHEIRYEGIAPHGHYCVPIVYAGRTLGVINVYLREGHRDAEPEREFLAAVANTLAGIIERKRAEEELRLQSIALAAAANAVVITDREGRITWVNPAFTRLTGYTAEEVLGQNPRILKSGKHDQAFYQNLWQTILAGQVWRSEVINRRKDGSLYTDRQVIAPLRDASGAISHFVTIKEDITERKRAEEALARSERQFRDLVQTIDAIVWEADPATFQFTFVSDRAEAILGYPVAQWLAEPDFWVNHLHPADREQVVAFCVAATAEGRDHDFEYRMLAADGRIVWLRDRVRVITDKAGRVRQLRGLMVDITARKRTEEIRQALYEASREIQTSRSIEDRLAQFLQTARDVLRLDRVNVLLADPGGQWLQAVASLGSQEPLGTIRVPIGPEGGGLAQAYLTQEAVLWDGRGPVPEALRIRPPYDSIGALRSRIFAIVPLVVQGRAIGVLGVDRKHSRQPVGPGTLGILQLFASYAAPAIEHARLYEELRRSAIHLEATVEDRTRELQAANRRLEEASRHKSEFLSNMSHELRTPLNSILGFSQLLQTQTSGPMTEKQARYITHIHNSGEHLLALINDLLDLSKVEAGKLELRPQPFAVREALAAALREVQPQGEAKRLVLDLQVDEGIPSLTADPIRFRQILLNLLSNAIKFSPEGGRVTVRAFQKAESRRQKAEAGKQQAAGASVLHSADCLLPSVVIEVTDTGIGIKGEDLPKLFKEFGQLEAGKAPEKRGTGLGLALTKRLVELHGGTIRAESEGEGCGTTFTVRLPLAPPVA